MTFEGLVVLPEAGKPACEALRVVGLLGGGNSLI